MNHLRKFGFTLVELLVVIAMIGMLLALLIPGVQAIRESARQTHCQSRMTDLYTAISAYHVSHTVWPPGTVNPTSPIESVAEGYHQNWLVHLLPQLDQPTIAAKVDWSLGVYEGENETLRYLSISSLRCPSAPDVRANASNYAGSHHASESPIAEDNVGVFILNRPMVPEEDLVDGFSATFLLGEKIEQPDDLGWSSGTRASLRNVDHPFETPKELIRLPAPTTKTYVGGFGSAHRAGCSMTFASGNTRTFDRFTDRVVLQQLANRKDGAITQ